MDRKIKKLLVQHTGFVLYTGKVFHLIERSYIPLSTVFYIEVHAVPNFASLLL